MATTYEYNAEQIRAIAVTERVTSSLSFLGCAFVILTFSLSARFRRPVNRIMFFASIGNLIYCIPGFIALDGIAAGADSGLCQAQAFLIQAVLPADVLWNFSMALNVYFTVFKANTMAQLQAREPYYQVMNYGIPVCIAFACLFVNTHDRGRIYGNAAIWCWITPEWEFLRIVICYGIAWACMLASFTIYIAAGWRIWKENKEVQEAQISVIEAGDAEMGEFETVEAPRFPRSQGTMSPNSPRIQMGIRSPSRFTESMTPTELNRKPFQRAAYQARSSVAPSDNRSTDRPTSNAVKRYTLSCAFFFLSLLMTWVPSSINRVWAAANPGQTAPFGLAYTAAFVLPLTGFWNSLVYIVMSKSSIQMAWHLDVLPAIESAKKSLGRLLSCGSRSSRASQYVSHQWSSGGRRDSFGTSRTDESYKNYEH